MELMNIWKAAASGAWLAGASSVIGVGTVADAAGKVKGFQHERVMLSGMQASSAAVGRMLTGRRVLLVDADTKLLAEQRMPAVNISARPRNWSIVLMPSTCQEALDHVMLAYGLAESKGVLLPATVVVPGMGDDVYQVVDVPGQKMAENVVGKLKLDPKHTKLAGGGLDDMLQMQKALEVAAKAVPTISVAWKKRFKRTLEPIERFLMDDAEIALIAYGPSCENAKIAVKQLRAQGEKVGLVRIVMMRPWPEAELSAALQKVSRIGVVDSQVSLGSWSKLYQGVRTWYSGFASNFISGELVSASNFVDIFKRIKSAPKPERVWMVK